MAQLPPKIPNMTSNWPEFSRQKTLSMETFPPTTTTPAVTHQNPSWVDEFLDFSSARRGSHRRSVSDSITFLEMPMLEEDCRASAAPPPPPPGSGDRNEFDRFDDEQFLSMFNDEISTAVAPTLSSSNPSTPSDHNSINHEKDAQNDEKLNQNKNESDEVGSQQQSKNQTQSNSTATAATAASTDRITDPKRVKRILANRQSAQRSRVRKLQYISELERSVTSLQAEVSVLSPRVAFLDHQRLLLNVDNSALKQRIAALAQDKIFKDAHQEALKREIERLRQVYHQQNMKKMENNAAPSPAITPSQPVTAIATDTKHPNVDQNDQVPNVAV
ncbi:basic leucine zipper 61-like [Benincasa hispida]|uniref:basic leucine zipper 61-like n=1 Tax=Benincasa hispida TaxID=102211 RepID=UPI0018FF7802|nr:basic leucine zipper 61-like [Benincasa hispida]